MPSSEVQVTVFPSIFALLSAETTSPGNVTEIFTSKSEAIWSGDTSEPVSPVSPESSASSVRSSLPDTTNSSPSRLIVSASASLPSPSLSMLVPLNVIFVPVYPSAW